MENVNAQRVSDSSVQDAIVIPSLSSSVELKAPAAVATAFPAATDIAVAILNAGGNAMDAAAAAAWALSVCEPSGSGLGGQTTALIRTRDGRMLVLDGHSRAPRRANRRTISAVAQDAGRRATTVPSTPIVLQALSDQFGKLPVSAAIEPAVALAETGSALTRLQRREIKWCWKALKASGSSELFLDPKGRLLKSGMTLRQPRLAATLRRLQLQGVDDFYRGALAQDIASDMSEHGGLIDMEDLAAAEAPPVRDPVEVGFAGYRVLSTPPTSGGVTLLQALKLSERLIAKNRRGDPTAHELEAVLDAVYAAFAFRERWPLAADEFTPSIQDWMLGDGLIDDLVGTLRTQARRPAIERGAEAAGETTHLCVADAAGNVVALTQSIQSLYGAKVAHPSLGFFYNNYLTTCVRYRHPNRLAAGCIPRSNVSPAIILDKDGSPRLAVGAAGSRRIVSATLQVIRRVLAGGEILSDAIAAPRGHALLNGKAWVEEPSLSKALRASLAGRYRQVIARKTHDYKMGCVQAISWDGDGKISAAADPRRDGTGTVLPHSKAEGR